MNSPFGIFEYWSASQYYTFCRHFIDLNKDQTSKISWHWCLSFASVVQLPHSQIPLSYCQENGPVREEGKASFLSSFRGPLRLAPIASCSRFALAFVYCRENAKNRGGKNLSLEKLDFFSEDWQCGDLPRIVWFRAWTFKTNAVYWWRCLWGCSPFSSNKTFFLVYYCLAPPGIE